MNRGTNHAFLWVFIAFLALGTVWPGSLLAQTQKMEHEAKLAQAQEKPTVLDHLLPMPEEKSPPIQTEKIDKAGEKLGNGIEKIGKKASGRVGNWINGDFFWGITWLKLLFCLALLLAVLILERIVHFLIQSRLKKKEITDERLPWYDVFLRGIARPISLFVWVYGTYGALSPLFSHFQEPDQTNPVHDVAKQIADVGGTISVIWFVYRLLGLIYGQTARWAAQIDTPMSRVVVALTRCSRTPLKFLVSLVLIRTLLPLLEVPEALLLAVKNSFSLCLIAAVAWLIIEMTCVLEDLFLGYYNIDVKDNLAARKVHTQVRFLRRLIVTVVIILASSSMLMVFEKVRQLGTSILASAGILGIVVGLAAQRSIANLLTGMQIAITQPIRLDDVVIVENEWGRVEEITSTYVVVKIWDLRRLIVPLTHFTEKPFQNWTRVSADLLGTVFLYVDYTVPVEEVRGELHSILQDSEFWDGKTWGVQVTNTTERAMELRLLMSASDASNAWNLRCEVREKLITFIQQNYPGSLPKVRAEIRREESKEASLVLDEEAGRSSLKVWTGTNRR